MPENVFIAIDGNALHSKSKVYIGRALARKGAGDLDEYQLWASLALELLGKAALARSTRAWWSIRRTGSRCSSPPV